MEGGGPDQSLCLQGKEGGLTARPPALTLADASSLPGTVILEPATVAPSQTEVSEVIQVMLTVPSIWPRYTHSVLVPAGSSLEDVLKKAGELGGFT